MGEKVTFVRHSVLPLLFFYLPTDSIALFALVTVQWVEASSTEQVQQSVVDHFAAQLGGGGGGGAGYKTVVQYRCTLTGC